MMGLGVGLLFVLASSLSEPLAPVPVSMAMCSAPHAEWCARYRFCGRAVKRRRKRACCELCYRSPECTTAPFNFCHTMLPQPKPTPAAAINPSGPALSGPEDQEWLARASRVLGRFF